LYHTKKLKMTTFIILLIAVLYSINDYDKLIQRKEKQSKAQSNTKKRKAK